jgi:hypothetical protein
MNTFKSNKIIPKRRSVVDVIAWFQALELTHIQVVVYATLFQKRLVCTSLNEASFFYDKHLISIADSAQTVSDDETGTPLEKFS